ncbi:lysophospholipid acyltransferase family protein [Chitinilyticum piscinae]|uniref:1-acyl-sn-glycerol-3-phosphate acyltransferase n=1 Tax=Chitinilyticum piscinae TaxID=2866724 RepID=A0A8J7FI71_9NEIS|nr:lysophospholipid acyltransferase family protein [Chitinilyticum piscinae]MBE9607827.1 1-acyl-sn-glycerol-3-phosphate acyltransferase [Chitinilyticum piscinae]
MSVRARLDWCRRLLGTAVAFSTFGVGGVVLGGVFPLLNRITPLALRRARARRLIHLTFSVFMRWMRWLGIMEWRIEGEHRLGRPGQLVVANHPSLLDVVFMMSHIREPNCVVKGGLWRNPCMVGPVSAAGFIPNHSSEQMVLDSIAALQEGDCLIVFPEGTRTTPGAPLHFHRGAATIAVKGAQVLTPVVLTITPTTLTKQDKWYKIPPRRFVMSLRVGDDIDLAPYRQGVSAPVAARRLNADLFDFYQQELQRG